MSFFSLNILNVNVVILIRVSLLLHIDWSSPFLGVLKIKCGIFVKLNGYVDDVVFILESVIGSALERV